jgi:rRNA maturation protein Nop10
VVVILSNQEVLMYVLIELSSECGGKFEAHVAYTRGTYGGDYSIPCPNCGERLELPSRLIKPLIKLK